MLIQFDMADRSISPERSRNMAAIRGKNTKPEMAVRSMLHRLGLRFSLHRKNLPGSPDVVLPRHQTAVFVHGCYWHRHKGCRFAFTPKSRIEFWQTKFDGNVERDRRKSAELEADGWRVIVVWECELREPEALRQRLIAAFGVNRT